MSKLSDSSRCLTMSSTQFWKRIWIITSLVTKDIFQSLRDWNHKDKIKINFIKMLTLLCVSNVEASILLPYFDVILSHRYVNNKKSEQITYLYRIIFYWMNYMCIDKFSRPTKKEIVLQFCKLGIWKCIFLQYGVRLDGNYIAILYEKQDLSYAYRTIGR